MRPGDRIGKYVLEARLGSGGMAQVWAARAEGPQDFVKPVALKFILPAHSQDPTYGELFFNEAKLAASLHHANLVSVFDFDRVPGDSGTLGGLYYIAMERVEGRDLSAAMRAADERVGGIPERLALFIMGQILEGLRYLHERERFTRQAALVHRDLSPHNVLLSYAGEVKISDFGIAKSSTSATTGDHLRGKLAYMAPELLSGQRATPLTDQFAAGIVFWELLSGRRLFAGNNDAHTLENVRRCEIPAPGRPGAQPVSDGLRAIVDRMLAREPAARFPSTAAAAAALAGSRAGTGAAQELSELMLRLFPFDEETTLAEHAETVHIFDDDPVGPVPLLRATAGLTLPDEDEHEVGSADVVPTSTKLLAGAGGDEAALPLTRTLPRAGRAPARPAKLPRDPDFAVARMPEHFAAAERAMQAARENAGFTGDFEDWLRWNAERGRDAVSGRPLPDNWTAVAGWPRFSELGWRRPLTFNWYGTFPWGGDGYWIAEDATADEMMVLFADDLARAAFTGVDREAFLAWWHEREVDIEHEGPGGARLPISRQARALLDAPGMPRMAAPHTRGAWIALVRAHEQREAASLITLPGAMAMATAPVRPSFWQKLSRLSRGGGAGGSR